MKNKKGFTIVELVIVIAVIAILAAVLIPTFSGVISKANASGALQEATSTMKSTLAMSESGTLASGTQFIIVSGTAPSYKFVYENNQIKSIEKNKELPTEWNTIILNNIYIDGNKFTSDGAKIVNAALGEAAVVAAGSDTATVLTSEGTGYTVSLTIGGAAKPVYFLINTDYAKDVVTITNQNK